MLLALDTATRHSGLALYHQAQVMAELNWLSRDAQTVELLPRVEQLLAWSNVAPADLSALAVNLGPGSFTGLRVALSLAKGMALTHNLPLLGVSGFDVTAYPHLHCAQPVAALVTAGRGRCYLALYQPDETGDTVLGAWRGWRSTPLLLAEADLPAALPAAAWITGEITPPLYEALTVQGITVALPAAAQRRAAALAELAWLRHQRGEADDLASLAPVYLQEP